MKISCGSGDPILRQTPGSRGIWGDICFHLDSDNSSYTGPFDHWVVFESVISKTSALCSGETIFVPWEPEVIKQYSPEFVRQFDRVLSSRTDISHSRIIPSHPMLPWWIGTTGGHGKKTVTRNYDSLASATSTVKLPLVSCICSNKVTTEGHRKRLEFVKSLQKEMGDQLVVFGPGFKDLDDKWDGVSPYQYHLALENSSAPDYWTEKVADAFLANSFLFYWGCPNLSDYFPSNAFMMVDRNDPVSCAQEIKRVIGLFESNRPISAVEEAKRLVLDSYNLFPELVRQLESLPIGKPKRRVICPERRERRSVVDQLRGIFKKFCRKI